MGRWGGAEPGSTGARGYTPGLVQAGTDLQTFQLPKVELPPRSPNLHFFPQTLASPNLGPWGLSFQEAQLNMPELGPTVVLRGLNV